MHAMHCSEETKQNKPNETTNTGYHKAKDEQQSMSNIATLLLLLAIAVNMLPFITSQCTKD